MKMSKGDREFLKDQYELTFGCGHGRGDAFAKGVSGYLDLGDVVLTMNKPSIQKRFWFAEYGNEDRSKEAEACSKSFAHFMAKNMRQCEAQRCLERLDEEGYPYTHPAVFLKEFCDQPDECRLGYVRFADAHGTFPRFGSGVGAHRMMTPEEVERWREFLTDEVGKFRKRLETYLKRYGLAKCSYDTYWADR